MRFGAAAERQGSLAGNSEEHLDHLTLKTLSSLPAVTAPIWPIQHEPSLKFDFCADPIWLLTWLPSARKSIDKPIWSVCFFALLLLLRAGSIWLGLSSAGKYRISPTSPLTRLFFFFFSFCSSPSSSNVNQRRVVGRSSGRPFVVRAPPDEDT